MKLLIAVLLFCTSHAMAEDKQNLSQFLNHEIVQTTGAFSNVEHEEPKVNAEGWYHNTTRLRVRPLLGLEVSWLAKAEIKPSVEFIWKRKTPKGYTKP